MDNQARETKAARKALKTAHAQNRVAETCAESVYESGCLYRNAGARVKSLASVRGQGSDATVSPESSSNNAATQESESLEYSEEDNGNVPIFVRSRVILGHTHALNA
ncbi:hypothetical protein K3495_g10506 [Podosphaera aphanis]|nr:hypothetical protein K3495_g10506 [Podosphaera aphanis]